jgi:nicotinamidase-related amidase
MSAADVLMKPEECVMLLVDFQAGLGFGVESTSRQVVLNNAVALARTAVAFKVPVIASTSASRVYSGPLLPPLQEVLPSIKAIERRSMNVWEDDAARNAVVTAERRRLIVAGFLTEACVSFSVLSALKDGFEVFVVADACGGLTPQSHEQKQGQSGGEIWLREHRKEYAYRSSKLRKRSEVGRSCPFKALRIGRIRTRGVAMILTSSRPASRPRGES